MLINTSISKWNKIDLGKLNVSWIKIQMRWSEREELRCNAIPQKNIRIEKTSKDNIAKNIKEKR